MAKKYQLTPQVAGLFESITGFKYSFHQAVGDLVDNSIDAGANVINIDATKEHVVLADNGSGMNFETLKKAITPWATAKKKRTRGERGKYGIGLKAAGFSLGSTICIHTLAKDDDFLFLELSRATLANLDGDTILGPDDGKPTKLWKDRAAKWKTGTIIEITELNSRKITADAIQMLRNNLGLMFFRLLEDGDLKITVNNAPVEPIHPLLPDLAKNSKKNYYHAFKKKDFTFKGASFTLSAASIGRGLFWTEDEKKQYRFFLTRKKSKDDEDGSDEPQVVTEEDFSGKKIVRIEDQGLYICRNGHLITAGGWAGTRAFSHHNSNCRVLIEFDSNADSILGVDHTKTKPEFEKDFINYINDKYIDEVFSSCEDRFREEGDDFKSTKQRKVADPELKHRAMSIAEAVNLLRENERKRDEFIPEYKTAQEELAVEQAEAIKDEWISFVDRLPYDGLWEPKQNRKNEVTVLLCDRHPGYKALYEEDDEDKRRKHLNLFFLNMATYEAEMTAASTAIREELKAELKKLFADFRRYVSRNFREF